MPPRTHLCRIGLAIAVAVASVMATASAAAVDPSRPVNVRIRWGGGTPQAWSGRIDVLATDSGAPPAREWRTLSTQRDTAASVYDERGSVIVHQSTPTASDGIEISIHDWPRARLVAAIGPAANGSPAATFDLPLEDILASAAQRPLDSEGNRLIIEQTPGDALQVEFDEPARPGPVQPLGGVRRPGDRVRLRIAPLLLMKPGGGDVELRVRLSPARQDTVLDSRVIPLASGFQIPETASPSGQIPTSFTAVACELTLPKDEGAYDIVLEAVERRGLRWNRQLATRKLQLVAIADTASPPALDEPWKVVHDLDPGSPRLHERLRRLPARGLQAVPRPTVSLPAMPLPSFTRPSLSMPRMPDVPMPAVPMPDVSSLVPRLGGLLASGHSTVVPHPLGPMLRLPQAVSVTTPSWEGIVIATARPGYPHVVEIEYPTDTRTTIAACILEADTTGTTVEVRHAGGFEVTPSAYDGPVRLGTHRFVFWPTTRQPLLVLANPITTGPAIVGRVQVLAGPARLPRAASARPTPVATQEPRQTFALMNPGNLTQRYGGSGHTDPHAGRTTTDWLSHLTAIRHSADAVKTQGLAGSVVTVYSGGAAAWSSRFTRAAPRWANADSSDGVGHDLLTATARIYAREGLSLVPGLCFDGAMPILESLRAEDNATGIVCVGVDGRPRRNAGSMHYNILDPRVQQAVEDLVVEAANRLSDAPSITGFALLLPDDGWLHLPGVAWGLDDATFGRFLTAIGEREADQGEDRFASRSRLVTGSLRNEWLTWRSRELTAFYARLAAKVAERDSRKLFVMPTTLLTSGELASRFRPMEGARQPHDDLVREIGLVAAVPSTGQAGELVFVPPHVVASGARLADRSTVARANTALATASSASGTSPRAASIVVRPLDVHLGEILSHGPFPSATLHFPCRALIETAAPAGDPSLAYALMRADAQVVFDMRMPIIASFPDAPPQQVVEHLPALPFELLPDVPLPLVVRTRTMNRVTWVQLVNAGPAPVEATLRLNGPSAAVVDASNGGTIPLAGDRATVALTPWDVRSLVIDGEGRVISVTATFAPSINTAVATAIERARQRLGVLEAPTPLDVLDNPGFELGLADGTNSHVTSAVTGWELLEPRRGSLELVPGLAPQVGKGRAIRFSSRNGLSTVRSNPFGPPATGRISVAAWLRLDPGEPQPPLRIAIEGVENNREYYRFAAVGGLTGGRPLTPEWALFVLQVDDLPTESVESLRVRFDLLGPGGVQIDEVRVFDLAFDETQRAEIARSLARIDHRFKAGDVGGALVELEGHWPAFLEAFVTDEAVAARHRAEAGPQATVAPSPPDEPRQGMLDRFRGWW